MSITLELTDEQQRVLHQIAEDAGESEINIALKAVTEYIERNSHKSAVRAAGAYVEQKNAELYRRLA